MGNEPDAGMYPPFNRKLFDSDEAFTVIGAGQIGGKALGLASAKGIIAEACPPGSFPDVTVSIPRLTVLGTEVFEHFLSRNDLREVARADLSDDRIAHAFLQAELPPLIVGDLRELVAKTNTPLAVRSSSLLEDALRHPFAGVYATKMIPNNLGPIAARFKKLTEAIKLVWASTFFRDAKRYLRSIERSVEDERMAVIVQEVVGDRFDGRFYPIVSGVVRTHNFYATGPAAPADGVVHLALGLGKTIVDGGVTWTYCPRYPRRPAPYGSAQELLRNTQTGFWAVHMGPVPYDPVNEAEYLVRCGLNLAEWDDVLRFVASTYDRASDRLSLGLGAPGPRAVTFGPILELDEIPLNAIVLRLSQACRAALESEVEIEFAMTLDRQRGLPARFGFLQVRPMMVAGEQVEVEQADLVHARALVASESVLGNGESSTITDVVYVKPGSFEARHTRSVVAELDPLNAGLQSEKRPYVLIGFGRWGSSDPWLGIPATWPQLCGARVIVEATLPDMDVEATQGSHFFHNMISFNVQYFTVRHDGPYRIAWEWLDGQSAVSETRFLRHVRLAAPLEIRVDGRRRRGLILHS